ncbi:acetyltransferase [Fundicoccus culcitae]|uniref:Acetyltransferase n=1 Tax=Fundicoccus culcitae TaxID=2969821 RepID=A0ABY5P9J1_9LACT|nr:acetyltransferase [Fundicoccus culcitae]UUX35266.1 acetyltransferase [Fundicoccus culcitae]
MEQQRTLYILGAGGHGKVVADAAKRMQRWQAIYFLDDKLINQTVLGIPVIAGIHDLSLSLPDHQQAEFIVAIGDNASRCHHLTRLKQQNLTIATIIHPTATIAADVTVGVGTVIFAQVVINASTKIGNGCILNTACSVDHDCTIEDGTHLSPGARLAGGVHLHPQTWIGTNSTLINNVEVAAHSIIGAHSLVLDDLKTSGTYVGNPVRKIK